MSAIKYDLAAELGWEDGLEPCARAILGRRAGDFSDEATREWEGVKDEAESCILAFCNYLAQREVEAVHGPCLSMGGGLFMPVGEAKRLSDMARKQ